MKSPLSLSSKYNSIAAIIAGALLVTILIVLLLIQPAWGKLKGLGSEIPAAETKRDQVKADVANLEKAKEFFAKQQEEVDRVNTAVPTQSDVPSILALLESLARTNNVFLTSFVPQQSATAAAGGTSPTAPATGATTGQADASGASTVEISTNFRGNYSSLINFFYALERSLRIIDVKTLTVNSSAGGLEGTLSFKAYYKPVDGVTKGSGSGGSGSGTGTPSSGGSSSPGSSTASPLPSPGGKR